MNTFETLVAKHSIIIVYDTEFTTWEGAMARDWSGPYEHRELVQLAAQKVDLVSGVVLDSFERLVQPRINPVLSNYFISLTGITNEQVARGGVDFEVMYEALLAWAGEAPFFSYSMRLESYADADVLQENITLYQLPITLPRERFHTLTELFQSAQVDTTKYNSGKLYQAFNINLTGHEHNAMFDVTSLVQSLFAVKKRWIEE